MTKNRNFININMLKIRISYKLLNINALNENLLAFHQKNTQYY